MKTKFLSICTGITMVLFGASCFVYSITSANAQPAAKPTKIVANETSKTGKYQICIESYGSDNELYAVVLNTESGKSETYLYKLSQGVRSWVKMNAQLPEFTF